jgi:hypothetical protein
MALITSPDVLPEAMRYLLRTVLSHPAARCDRADLLLLVAPEGLPEAMKPLDRDKAGDGETENTSASGKLIATRSLAALTTLKLVTAEGSDIVATDATHRRWSKVSAVSAPSFSRALRAQVWLAATAADDAPSDDRVDDLVNGLAVLHASPDPLRPFEFETGLGRRFNIAQALWYGPNKTDWPVTNDVQFAPFGRWAAYLGCAQYVDTRSIIADASTALVDDLRALPAARYRMNEFIERCAEALPVSDGGTRSLWKPDDLRDISPGLSMTLLQLEAYGHVSIPAAESDRDSMMIAVAAGAAGRPASHLDWHPRSMAEERS